MKTNNIIWEHTVGSGNDKIELQIKQATTNQFILFANNQPVMVKEDPAILHQYAKDEFIC